MKKYRSRKSGPIVTDFTVGGWRFEFHFSPVLRRPLNRGEFLLTNSYFGKNTRQFPSLPPTPCVSGSYWSPSFFSSMRTGRVLYVSSPYISGVPALGKALKVEIGELEARWSSESQVPSRELVWKADFWDLDVYKLASGCGAGMRVKS